MRLYRAVVCLIVGGWNCQELAYVVLISLCYCSSTEQKMKPEGGPPACDGAPEEEAQPCNAPERTAEHGDKFDTALIRDWAKLSAESITERLQRYVEYLTLPVERLRSLATAFKDEIHLGLGLFAEVPNVWQPDKCSFKMLDSHVPALPTGAETGVFYAVDLGGTNFRVVRADLRGDGRMDVRQQNAVLTESSKGDLLTAATPASRLFEFMAEACKEFVEAQGDDQKEACFTFSFPCTQGDTLASATLVEWTKGIQTGRATDDPIEGIDIGERIRAEFTSRGVPLHVNSVINDTVGTLLSCAYGMDHAAHPPCRIGMIIGTGVNACYHEPRAAEYGYKGCIINLECGNFNRGLPLIDIDNEMDFDEVSNRGRQRLEKMVAGAYLGELARRLIVKVLQHQAPSAAWRPHSMSSKDVSLIAADDSDTLSTTADAIRRLWGEEKDAPIDDPVVLSSIHRLCSCLLERSAALAAVIVAGITQKLEECKDGNDDVIAEGLSVGIDGALYKKVPRYRDRFAEALHAILGEDDARTVHVLTADDGSGKGAAVLAAVLTQGF